MGKLQNKLITNIATLSLSAKSKLKRKVTVK